MQTDRAEMTMVKWDAAITVLWYKGNVLRQRLKTDYEDCDNINVLATHSRLVLVTANT